MPGRAQKVTLELIEGGVVYHLDRLGYFRYRVELYGVDSRRGAAQRKYYNSYYFQFILKMRRGGDAVLPRHC